MEKDIKGILKSHNFSFKKCFGQNFLTDKELLFNIVKKAGVNACVNVLEIGTGAGTLTSFLCKNAKFVLGYEVDQTLKPILNETLSSYNNYEIVFKDIMKEDLHVLEKKLGNNYIMVANLPYYITTPIVLRFLEEAKSITSLVVMVQKEVAERFCAKEGTADYGAITIAINLRGSARIIEYVGREKFSPPPNVDSAVVKIDIDKEKNKDVDLSAVREVVRVAFSSRRKMLVNNLMNGYKMTRLEAEEILIKSNIQLSARGEVLSAEDFIHLSKNIKG